MARAAQASCWAAMVALLDISPAVAEGQVGAVARGVAVELTAVCGPTCFGPGTANANGATIINVFKRPREGKMQDPRIQIDQNKPENKRYRVVGAVLASEAQMRTRATTGTLVGPCLVLTANHSVRQHVPAAFEVVGQDGAIKRIRGEVISNPAGIDIALIKLTDCVGLEIGWAEVRPTWDVEFTATTFESAGYPHGSEAQVLTVDRGCRAGVRPKRAYPPSGRLHYCSSRPGDSGGPIFDFGPRGVMRISMVMTGQINPVGSLLENEDEDRANYGIDLNSVSSWLDEEIEKDLRENRVTQALNPAAMPE